MNSTKIIDEISAAYKAGKKPAFSYDRVSTEEQRKTGMSLDYQLHAAGEYAKRNNLHIIYTLSSTESGYKEGRVNFNKMLDAALMYNVRDIIFKNTDRLGRNDIDWPRCKRMAKTEGFHIHLYELNTVFKHDSTAEEEMFLDNTSSMARYWSNKISQGSKKSYKYRAELGIPPGSPPVGYKYDRENRCWQIDKDRENMMRFIFDTFDQGEISIQDLTDQLNSMGYKSARGGRWKALYLHQILRNIKYAGYFQYLDDTPRRGNFEPYFSLDRYENRRKRLMDKHQGKRSRTFEYPMAGFLKCGHCGRVLTGEQKKGGRYTYYSHHNAEIPELSCHRDIRIVELIDREVEGIIYSETFAADMKYLFNESIEIKKDEQHGEMTAISQRIGKLEAKRNRLLDDYLDDYLDRDSVKKKLDEIVQDIAILERKRAVLMENKDEFISTMVDVIDEIRKVCIYEGTHQKP